MLTGFIFVAMAPFLIIGGVYQLASTGFVLGRLIFKAGIEEAVKK